MKISSTTWYWIVWGLGSIMLAGTLGYMLFSGDDKTLFMPGPLSDGHHQLAGNCAACHTDAFGGGEVLQQACVDCHGEDRVKPFDSHPRTKFTDPRNADRLEAIAATECVTCHTEHKPEITSKNGVTQPTDFCFHCHQDIAEERPSHEGMAFDTCASSGCHNFHNNRALYTDFLVKHMDAPPHKDRARVPGKEFASVLDELMDYPRDHYPIEALSVAQMDAPAEVRASAELIKDWASSSHAASGVNCTACHVVATEADSDQQSWLDNPGLDGCQSCHSLEVASFKRGKHGMKLASGLPPMTPEQARLPMHNDAAHSELGCASCHGSHEFNVRYAAVEGCLQCHDDEHSRNFKNSPHFELWEQTANGETPETSGVSCATCHMPRVEKDVNDWMSRKVVDHNQSATLSPNSKMIRPACLHCHGLGFSIDALADQALIDSNFNGQPSVHVESIDLARADQQRYLEEKARAMAPDSLNAGDTQPSITSEGNHNEIESE
ncbi:MAG: ammonia-forming cytochrome c nitrite reductase subunit c552 [bacterium]